jgi:hypothetical protein
VYSEGSLGITAHGVTVEHLPGADTQYHFRYSNLRLLLFSGDEYFLVPDDWRQGAGPVFSLKDGASVRFEFYGS